MQDELNDIQYTKPEDPDIVRVCRCKDCKNFGENDFPYTLCHRSTEAVEENDYCSYGERKDGFH